MLDQEARRKYIGASEVPAIVGCCPFKSKLEIWASKMGMPYEAGAQADIGHLFEGPLLRHYEQLNGVTVAYKGTLHRPEAPWMAATPDGIVEASRRNVQVKVVGQHMAHHWREGVPEYVQVQVQWEMWVADCADTHVVACVGGTDYQEHLVQRDEEMIDLLIGACGDFWRDYVLTGTMPEVDGSEEAKRVLRWKYKSRTAGFEVAGPEMVSLAREYLELGEKLDELKQQREMIGNIIRVTIGHRDGLRWDGGTITWTPNKLGVRNLLVKEKRRGR